MPQQTPQTLTRADRKLSSFNAEARTVDIVLATETEVKRRSWEDGLYIEILAVSNAAIDATRLDALPLLDQHDAYSGLSARLGSILAGSLRIERGQAVVTAKISRNAGGEALFRDLEDGHVLGASVGYRIDAFEKVEAPTAGGLPTIRATRWTPLELSIVSIPADPAATTRAHEPEKEHNMPETLENERQVQQQPAANVINERTRAKGLRDVARLVGIGDDVLERAIEDGTSVDAFRARALDTMVTRQNASPTFPYAEMRGGNGTLDNPDLFRSSAAAAILARSRGQQPEGAAAAVFAEGEVAFARRCLLNAGRDIRGWSDDRVRRGYITTSDFAYIAGTVANTRIVDYYNESLSQLPQLFGRRTVPDFNKHTEAFVDWTVMSIDKVNEHGEFKSSYVDEDGETIQVVTWGGIVPLSRQLIVNAAGTLDRMAEKQGKALASKVNTLMAEYPQLNNRGGPKLKDGVTVFHANRGNIEQLNIDTDPSMQLMKLRAKMARRKGKGDVIIGTHPKFWLVHPDFEGQAIKILAAVQASSVADVNPVAGRLTIVSDPRLTSETTSWLVCDPAAMEGAVRVYLEGEEEPHTDSEVGFEIDGVKFKIRQDFGLGWLEWRSWTRLDHLTNT